MIKKKVFIETYGCQMNKLDSENVHSILKNGGFDVVDYIKEADIILLNTCGVRENAETRVMGRISELMRLKKAKPGLFLGVIGCMAQRIGDDLVSDFVRIVAGPDSYRDLPEMIAQAIDHPAMEHVLNSEEIYKDVNPIRASKFSAWVAVTRGCDNYCSYCIVPFTRGRERSVPSGAILEEICKLKENGWKEVTLLGQNVNSYSDGDIGFAELLCKVSDTGIDWVRFITSHPKDLNNEILDVMSERDNICNHLHLPLQSGSDKILSAMNRKYDVMKYLKIVETARKKIKGLSLTTDLIFGFPGEKDEDFNQTIKVMEEIGFDFGFLYRYSEREGTAANNMKDSVPMNVRLERLQYAIDLQNRITAEKNKERVGTNEAVLVKGKSRNDKGWLGFSATSIPVVINTFDSGIGVGSLVNVTIESTTGACLIGKII